MRDHVFFGVLASAYVVLASPLTTPVLQPLVVTARLTPGGHNVTITGTSAEDVYNQIVAMNPSYDADWAGSKATTKNIESRRIVKRNSLKCGAPWHPADESQIESGIKYLRGLHGASCQAPAGPGGCARVSCAYNAAIGFCNDNRYPYSVLCSDIANVAQDIVNNCAPAVQYPTVAGQEFNPGNWNVIVHSANC